MGIWRWTAVTVVVIGTLLPDLSAAQSQPPAAQSGQPERVSVVYVPPNNFGLQEVYDLLRQHNALERIKEILSPFRLPEQLTIETAECGAVNSNYQRKNLKPTVTLL
jgi:Putative metallopeptidase